MAFVCLFLIPGCAGISVQKIGRKQYYQVARRASKLLTAHGNVFPSGLTAEEDRGTCDS